MEFDSKKWLAVGLAATRLPLHDERHVHFNFSTNPLGSLSRAIAGVTSISSATILSTSYGGVTFLGLR